MNKTPFRQFKGTYNEYHALHQWVRRKLGNPRKCEACDATDKKVYHWANASGNYLPDTKDWLRLCPGCHAIMDDWGRRPGTHCTRGHELKGENLYFVPSRGNIECRTCKRMYHSKAWKERKQHIIEGGK